MNQVVLSKKRIIHSWKIIKRNRSRNRDFLSSIKTEKYKKPQSAIPNISITMFATASVLKLKKRFLIQRKTSSANKTGWIIKIIISRRENLRVLKESISILYHIFVISMQTKKPEVVVVESVETTVTSG